MSLLLVHKDQGYVPRKLKKLGYRGIDTGEVQFKVEKSGVVQAGLGKVSFDKQKISENITAFIESVNKAKPAGAKGSYLKKISVSSTMGPSVTIDSNQFAN